MTVKPWTTSPDYGDCQRCGRIMVEVDSHVCPPAWTVWEEDQGSEEEGHLAYGEDPEAAVEKWLDSYDAENEYSILRHGSATIIAKRGDRVVRLNVEAESRAHYSAREEGA